MTYCAGWKYKDAVFLLADTAVTTDTKPVATHSSFGQLHGEVRGEHVYEGALKLVPLGEGMIAAYAGDIALAANCLNFLRDSLPSMKGARALLKSLTINLGPFPKERTVELLVAASSSSGACDLFRWDTVQGVDSSDSDFYQIGSLTSFHSALTPTLLSEFATRNLDIERMLSVVSAIVQSYGIHDDLIAMNIGGLIFGAQTQGGHVNWQHDTNYVLYSPNSVDPKFVTAIARDNSIILSSSITNDTRVLGHSTSMPGTNLWSEEWLRAVKKTLDSGVTPLWVFISTIGRAITVIFRQDMTKESRYVKLSHLGEGKFDLALSPEMMQLLNQSPKDKSDGSLPFLLNVRND